MQHTPYGYEIRAGRAVIRENEAENLLRICENYLAGMSLAAAAADVGIIKTHCGVRNMIMNPRLRGDGYYPAIITEELSLKLALEHDRREKALGRDKLKKKTLPEAVIATKFTVPAVDIRFEDPGEQAEYAYSLIESEVE